MFFRNHTPLIFPYWMPHGASNAVRGWTLRHSTRTLWQDRSSEPGQIPSRFPSSWMAKIPKVGPRMGRNSYGSGEVVEIPPFWPGLDWCRVFQLCLSCIFVFIYICIFVSLYLSIYLCIYVCVCMYIYMYIYICMFIYIYIYIYV